MKALLGVALLGSVVMAAPAHADFQLAPTRSDAAPAAQAESGLTRLSPEGPAPARRPVTSRGFPVAHGFGQQIPLAFATRQIVPAQAKVTFGPEVDQAALVDWTGGRPWVEALRAAVRPLGLRVSVRWMAVSITRG